MVSGTDELSAVCGGQNSLYHKLAAQIELKSNIYAKMPTEDKGEKGSAKNMIPFLCLLHDIWLACPETNTHMEQS